MAPPASAPPGPPALPVKPDKQENTVRPVLRHAAAPTPAATRPTPEASDILSESQLIGAIGADDEGDGRDGGTGECNTARILQQALQRDPMVLSAVEDAGRLGKAVMLWNGDWVRSGDQDGKGLAGVRQAILWELAFAPEACRSKRMHGMVVLSLADGTRFAIGSDDWRWSDLLGLRHVPADR